MLSLTWDSSGTEAARADLERLAAELAARGYQATLVARPGVRPYLNIRNPQAAVMTDQIYAEDEYFVWSWHQPVARRDQITDAADKVARVLRTLGSLGSPGNHTAELQVCSCEAGGPNGAAPYGMMGRVAGETDDGLCTVADEAPLLLPQRRSGAELLAEPAGAGGIPRSRESAEPRTPLDLDLLGKVLAGLRRLV